VAGWMVHRLAGSQAGWPAGWLAGCWTHPDICCIIGSACNLREFCLARTRSEESRSRSKESRSRSKESRTRNYTKTTQNATTVRPYPLEKNRLALTTLAGWLGWPGLAGAWERVAGLGWAELGLAGLGWLSGWLVVWLVVWLSGG